MKTFKPCQWFDNAISFRKNNHYTFIRNLNKHVYDKIHKICFISTREFADITIKVYRVHITVLIINSNIENL